MKTSINLLRDTNACTGGFGRQASFWTVRPAAKAIEYPIWMVGLIGNYDDLCWAIDNSLIIDEKEFKELKDRTFWPMFNSLLWQELSHNTLLQASQNKKGLERDAIQEVLKVKTKEEAQAWITKWSRFKINHRIFSNVANHQCWADPQNYLDRLTNAITLAKSDLCIEHERHPFDLDHHLPAHDSRTMKSMAKTAVRRTARRVDRDDDEEDTPSNAKKRSEPPVKEQLFFDIPVDGSRIMTKGERFAYVVLNEDPWPAALQFLLDNDVPKIIGSKLNLSKVSTEAEKPPKFAASLHLNDPRTIFTLMHLLQGQDFDLLKAMHISPQMDDLQSALERYGNGPRLQDLEDVVDNQEYGAAEIRLRVAREIQNSVENVEAAGPTNNAVRERRIRTTRATATISEGDDEPDVESDDNGDDAEDEEL